MNTLVWLVAPLVLGLATGRIIGALLTFTGGRIAYDLTAGLLGALTAGVFLRLVGSSGLRSALPTLLVGVAAAILATWLTRIATWRADPVLRLPVQDSAQANDDWRTHDVMTTADGTRLLLTAGRLVALEEAASPSVKP